MHVQGVSKYTHLPSAHMTSLSFAVEKTCNYNGRTYKVSIHMFRNTNAIWLLYRTVPTVHTQDLCTHWHLFLSDVYVPVWLGGRQMVRPCPAL